MNYQPTKYHNIGQEELFIDHHQSEGFWGRVSRRLREIAEVWDARLRLLVDKRARSTYRVRLVRQQLRDVGLSSLDLMKPETHSIAKLLHKNEKILGAMVGYLENGGSALLVATNLRVVCLNQIPLFTNMDEMKYDAINAVSTDSGRWSATVTLHTDIKDFTFHSVTLSAAAQFVESIEKVSIDSVV